MQEKNYGHYSHYTYMINSLKLMDIGQVYTYNVITRNQAGDTQQWRQHC